MKDNVQSKLSYLNFNITTKDEVMCDVFCKRLGDYVKNVSLIQSLLKNLTTWLLKSKKKKKKKKKKKNGWSLKYMETVKLEMIK